ncbi:ROK family protein [Umezawaea tangerina]|uniref:Putative NBD/HSP70 family sugar kinase n=1 Tax=Umezawaea tangerina TaxID=84725 RepID=A0A2T0T2I0_9PSEU|nr:ROK family protein [Umezawaea tangerina]PRY39844.1 putative NBD/HSP70 family sugar kinase [Umezawaea tangerina]
MPHTPGPADRAGLRRANLDLLVRMLRERGQVSRAQLAVHSGLSKATVSSLVGDLARRGVVRPAGITAGGQGRPGELVELRPAAACGVGLDLQVDHVGATVVDLTGEVLLRRRIACDVPSSGHERVLDLLADVLTGVLDDVRARGGWVVGATAAVPGLVDTDGAVVRFASRLRWREVALRDGLAARTGLALDFFGADNDANLAAVAEHDAGAAAGLDDFVHLAGGHGVGAGVFSRGELVRGHLGYAGEVGHMMLDPLGPWCSCGRRGCWETQVGLGALLHACATPDDPVHDPALDPDARMVLVRARAETGDRRTLDALHQIGAALGAGAAVLVNLLNPAAVVLGGYFAALPEWLVEPVRSEVAARVLAEGAGGATVVASRLGFRGPSTGGAVHALRRVLDEPAVVPVDEHAENTANVPEGMVAP